MINLIPTGKENAILLKDLAALTGKAPRTVQADIQLLRDNGFVILSSAAGGYYFPSTDEKGVAEATRYMAMMESQAFGRLKRLGAVKKWLKEYGQVQFKEVEEI